MATRVPTQNRTSLTTAVLIAVAVVFAYASVVAKLGRDWWTDENYSHGLLVPFVIGFIVWGMRDRISGTAGADKKAAWGAIVLALLMLTAGTLGAELFTQRISLVVMLAGVALYFFGRRILALLAVPFALLLLAIPIPQILLNRIILPLQMWASQLAVWGIRLFSVPTLRKGNVIDILPNGAVQPISLEVVEACSGIRSLMTLVTIGLVLGYMTRTRDAGRFANLSRPDLIRTLLLMAAAVPVAVATNAARVAATGVMTYHYGKQATGSTVHDASGWLVYIAALAVLIGINYGLRKLLRGDGVFDSATDGWPAIAAESQYLGGIGSRVWPLVAVLMCAAVGVNWLGNRSEVTPARQSLSAISSQLGIWSQRGTDIRFDPKVEDVLRATDYTMREYTDPTGRIANVYVGYYSTQRTGATYHSPQNCLPGAGWVMSDPQVVTVTTPQGRTINANRYILENGIYREVMLYWYQGRGRTEASEYRDKLNTIYDSITRRRTDGAMVRVMTDVGDNEPSAYAAVSTLASELEDQLPAYIPE